MILKHQSRILVVLLLPLLAPWGQVRAQVKTSSPVEQRAADLMSLIRAAPGEYEKYFSKDFLAQVPPDKLTAIFAYYSSSVGPCMKAETTTLESPLAGKFNFVCQRANVPVNLAVDAAEPHLIAGFVLGNPVSLSASLDDLIKEFKALPGESSFLVARLGNNQIEPVAAYNVDRQLAIGSAFKLYVLSELLRSVNKRERKWPDVLTLAPEAKSLPSGFLQNWPAGSPFTLYTVAGLMISQSDNTAADQLLYFLGRENVEKMLAVAGHSKPELNMPFLSTLEMFRLKGEPGGTSARAYLSQTTAQRRAFLKEAVSQINKDTISFPAQPSYIDSIEWFASAADLCRVMNWIRLNSESEPGMAARDILSINLGLAIPKDKWKYAGYKGGSESGVMNMTYLLQSSAGDWYALSASWNNPKAPVDQSKLVGLVGRGIQLIP